MSATGTSDPASVRPVSTPSAAVLGLAGAVSLAVAMGIGRFAFTPLLPLMIQGGQLDVAGGGWIAAANYAGYLLGALTAARTGLAARPLALRALVATALLTGAMALPLGFAGWLVLRLLAGVASAWVFVSTAVWCLGALARLPASAWSSGLYAGVGTGITAAGLLCLAGAAAGLGAAALWTALAVMAAVLALPAAAVMRRLPPAPVATSASHPAAALPSGTSALVVSYGLFGFGYILPATYLPVLARQVVEDPRLFGLAWPLFGLTAALSVVGAAWLLRRASRLQVWAASHGLMGIGVLLPSVVLHPATIALSALLVGGTFMVATLAGVQEVRARTRGDPTAAVGRMTAAFALGQIAGPVVSSLLLRAWPGTGLDLALQAGAAALLLSGAWLWQRSRKSLTPTPSQEETRHVRSR